MLSAAVAGAAVAVHGPGMRALRSGRPGLLSLAVLALAAIEAAVLLGLAVRDAADIDAEGGSASRSSSIS